MKCPSTLLFNLLLFQFFHPPKCCLTIFNFSLTFLHWWTKSRSDIPAPAPVSNIKVKSSFCREAELFVCFNMGTRSWCQNVDSVQLAWESASVTAAYTSQPLSVTWLDRQDPPDQIWVKMELSRKQGIPQRGETRSNIPSLQGLWCQPFPVRAVGLEKSYFPVLQPALDHCWSHTVSLPTYDRASSSLLHHTSGIGSILFLIIYIH